MMDGQSTACVLKFLTRIVRDDHFKRRRIRSMQEKRKDKITTKCTRETREIIKKKIARTHLKPKRCGTEL